MKYVVLFLLLLYWTISPAFARVLTISNFPQYEFFKRNFSFNDGISLNTLEDRSPSPFFSINFFDKEISTYFAGNQSMVQWEKGISGKAPSFYGSGSYLILSDWKNFFSREKLSAFTLSFYFLPRTVMREESLLEKQQKISFNQSVITSSFRVFVKNGYVHWDLKNFFRIGKKKFSRFLRSNLSFRPGEWNHLVLGYDVKNARLTMFLNKEMVDFAYVTSDGKKSGPKYIVGFQSDNKNFYTGFMDNNKWLNNDKTPLNGEWVLGKGFVGLIDELELFDKYEAVPSRFNFQDKASSSYQSVYASQVFRIDKNTQIDMVNIEGKNLDKQFIRFYLCSSKNFFLEYSNFSNCNRILGGKQIEGYPVAEFYQFFLVYNNLEHSLKSLDAIHLSYKEDSPPLPPQWVTLNQTRDGILLEWRYTLEKIDGYRIYYRMKYFKGKKAVMQLPLEELEVYKTQRSWAYLLRGLEKDQLYFLGIKSYDFHEGRIRESNFSPIKSFYYSSEFF